ncbi:MAG: UbiA-like polyprenyltransferase [Helicobacter sp.]|nr:UbiA-like polyprenyltransferase [Helicobacter sp.]
MNKIKQLLDLVVFKHSIFSATFGGVAICAVFLKPLDLSDLEIYKILFLCVICILSARNFAMGFNRLVDAKIDILNPRTKDRPSANGAIPKPALSAFCIINALIFIGASFFINNLAFVLSPFFIIILGGYSFFKRFSSSAHFILGLSLSLAPIACTIAFLGHVPLWSIALSAGVGLWVSGFDLLYSIQDMDFDKKMGLFSIPAKLGAHKSMIISRLCHIGSVALWGYFLILIDSAIFGFLGLLASALMLIYQHILVAKNLLNIPKAFFVVNGYLGFIFLFAMILELVFRRLN